MSDVVATLRDVAIIFLALESIAIGAILIVLVLEVRNLARMLRDESKTILGSANETVRTVRGTTTFVSDNFVAPVIRVSAFASGVAEAVRILARRAK